MSTRKANSRHWFSAWKRETYVPYWQVWKLEPAAGSSIRPTKRERQERDDVDSSSSGHSGDIRDCGGYTLFNGRHRREFVEAVAHNPACVRGPPDRRRDRGTDARHLTEQSGGQHALRALGEPGAVRCHLERRGGRPGVHRGAQFVGRHQRADEFWDRARHQDLEQRERGFRRGRKRERPFGGAASRGGGGGAPGQQGRRRDLGHHAGEPGGEVSRGKHGRGGQDHRQAQRGLRAGTQAADHDDDRSPTRRLRDAAIGQTSAQAVAPGAYYYPLISSRAATNWTLKMVPGSGQAASQSLQSLFPRAARSRGSGAIDHRRGTVARLAADTRSMTATGSPISMRREASSTSPPVPLHAARPRSLRRWITTVSGCRPEWRPGPADLSGCPDVSITTLSIDS